MKITLPSAEDVSIERPDESLFQLSFIERKKQASKEKRELKREEKERKKREKQESRETSRKKRKIEKK